jgi:O-antigen/teichoic acid export membrane protein
MGGKKDFVEDAIVFGLGNGIKKFIGFFLLPFYTRVLSPADYGILDSVTTFTMLFSAFINVGLDSSSSFYFFRAKTDQEKGQILFSHLMLRVVSIIPPLILSFFSAAISKRLFNTDSYTWIVFISIVGIPVNLLLSEQSQIYRYYRKPWSYNIITIVKSLSNIGIGISLVVILKWGIIGSQIASIISSLIVVIGSFVLFTRKVYNYSFSWFWTKKMMRYGFPLIWSSLAAWVFSSSDRFFLLHYSNLEAIGYYSIGSTFSQPIGLINSAIQMSFGVLFYKIYNEETDPLKPKTREMAIDSFNLYFGVAILLAAFLSIFGLDIVNLVATKKYGPGALAIPFLCFAAIASQGFQSMGPGIELAEKTWHFTWITIVTALVSIISNFILVPRLGFVGAGISSLIAFLVQWQIKLIVSQKYFYVNYPFLKLYSFFAIGLFISIFLNVYKFDISYTNLILIKAFTLGIIFLVGLYFQFIPVSEGIRYFKRKILKRNQNN